jgi:hypothetical protein
MSATNLPNWMETALSPLSLLALKPDLGLEGVAEAEAEGAGATVGSWTLARPCGG